MSTGSSGSSGNTPWIAAATAATGIGAYVYASVEPKVAPMPVVKAPETPKPVVAVPAPTPVVPVTPAPETPVAVAPIAESPSVAAIPETSSQTEAPAAEVHQVIPEAAPVAEAVVDRSPLHVPYVIVGAGTAGYYAAVGIKRRDKDAQILLIGEEDDGPYTRPPLSKELWFNTASTTPTLTYQDWGGKEKSIFFQDKEFYCTTDDIRKGDPCVGLLSGVKVTDIDVVKKQLFTSDGRQISYNKCLLATGGKPKSLAVFDTLPEDAKRKISLYRTANDFRILEQQTQKAESIAIIGGGFLGSEIAIALASRRQLSGSNLKIVQIFPENGNMAKVLPEYLSKWSTQKIESQGVEVIPNEVVTSATVQDDKVVLGLQNGRNVSVDRVIVAVGLQPETSLAQKAQLEIDPIRGGIVVNAELEARSDIYAAGDVASFYDVTLGRRREEHHDNAVVSGRLAGENMAGAKKHYQHQSFFWSDLGPEIGYEAIGIIDSSLETVGVWAKGSNVQSAKLAAAPTSTDDVTLETPSTTTAQPISAEPTPVETTSTPAAAAREYAPDFGKGVVFYLRDKRVVGVVAWNLPEKIPIARKIIREAKQHDNFAQLAALFKINAGK